MVLHECLKSASRAPQTTKCLVLSTGLINIRYEIKAQSEFLLEWCPLADASYQSEKDIPISKSIGDSRAWGMKGHNTIEENARVVLDVLTNCIKPTGKREDDSLKAHTTALCLYLSTCPLAGLSY